MQTKASEKRPVVRLSVHRNTKQQRATHATRRELISDAKDLGKIVGLAGYAIVAWDRNLKSWSAYKVGRTMTGLPMIALPEFVKGNLGRTMAKQDTADMLNLDGYNDDDDAA